MKQLTNWQLRQSKNQNANENVFNPNKYKNSVVWKFRIDQLSCFVWQLGFFQEDDFPLETQNPVGQCQPVWKCRAVGDKNTHVCFPLLLTLK